MDSGDGCRCIGTIGPDLGLFPEPGSAIHSAWQLLENECRAKCKAASELVDSGDVELLERYYRAKYKAIPRAGTRSPPCLVAAGEHVEPDIKLRAS